VITARSQIQIARFESQGRLIDTDEMFSIRFLLIGLVHQSACERSSLRAREPYVCAIATQVIVYRILRLDRYIETAAAATEQASADWRVSLSTSCGSSAVEALEQVVAGC